MTEMSFDKQIELLRIFGELIRCSGELFSFRDAGLMDKLTPKQRAWERQ